MYIDTCTFEVVFPTSDGKTRGDAIGKFDVNMESNFKVQKKEQSTTAALIKV
jgi:hypothetical protein